MASPRQKGINLVAIRGVTLTGIVTTHFNPLYCEKVKPVFLTLFSGPVNGAVFHLVAGFPVLTLI